MVCFLLLIVGHILLGTSGFILNCTNDLDTLMSCGTEAHNCSRLSLKVFNLHLSTGVCHFDPCVRGCCCTVKLRFLVIGDTFTANILKDGESVHSQSVIVEDTFKPPAPSIISVEPIGGLHRIRWSSNAKSPIRRGLRAVMSYQKKGYNDKTSEHVELNLNEDINYFEIRGRDLQPNTTYVVDVKTQDTHSSLFSDGSNKEEFKTSFDSAVSSTNGVLIELILCLSIAAVVLSGAVFVFVIRLKGKLWDIFNEIERPKILVVTPAKDKMILTPESPSVYLSSVELLIPEGSSPLSKEFLFDCGSGQTSGISTASSSCDYPATQPNDIEECVLRALKTDLRNFTPCQDTFSSEEPPLVSTSLALLEKTSSPVFYENITYISANHTDDVTLQLNLDSGYRSSDGPTDFSSSDGPTGLSSSDGPTLHDIITLPHGSLLVETAISSQPCTLLNEFPGDSQTLPVISGYQVFENLVEQSKSNDNNESDSKA